MTLETKLEQIATLLETKKLTDRDVLYLESWKESIRPITRPFLEQVQQALPFHTKFYTPQRANTKRETFDTLGTQLKNLFIIVYLGHADLPGGDLEHRLIWGAYAWGRASSAEAYRARLDQLGAREFTLREIDGTKSGAFGGGITVMLCKTLSPEELRRRTVDEVVQEIARDLRRLKELVEQDGQSGPGPDGSISAAALSDWLRRTHGLHFTPY